MIDAWNYSFDMASSFRKHLQAGLREQARHRAGLRGLFRGRIALFRPLLL